MLYDHFFFQGVQHVYFAKVMLTVSLNGNPMIKLIMHRDEIHKKKSNNVLNENVNVAKHSR